MKRLRALLFVVGVLVVLSGGLAAEDSVESPLPPEVTDQTDANDGAAAEHHSEGESVEVDEAEGEEDRVILPVLIVNADSAVEELDQRDLRDIYLGKRVQWENGVRIVLTTHPGCATHRLFLRNWIGTSTGRFAKFWKQQVFTGRGRMPAAFATAEELLAFVATTPGAIGYLDPVALEDRELEGLVVVAMP